MTNENVIFAYTAEQAIEDGCLVDASPETHPKWLLTRAVYERIMALPELQGEAPYSKTYKQRVIPLLMDVALIMRQPSLAGETLYTGDDLNGNLTGETLWFALNEIGGITIMFPSDY